MDRLWRSNSFVSSRTGCPPDIVNEEDHNVEKHDASILMCSRDARFKNFKDSILGMTTVSLYDGPIYFNCYPEPSFPYSRPASEEEDDSKSVCPSDSDFPHIDNSDYVKQLRVLTISNENFEVDLVPLYNEFMLSKNRTKRKYFQDNFA